MNKLHAVLLGVALLLPLLGGCNTKVAEATAGIEIVSVKLDDWTNPEDGKVYVVALPTWKNNGKEAVRQVSFLAAIDGKDVDQPKNDLKKPHYNNEVVEPGTTVTPSQVPDDGVVLGEKEKLKDIKAEDVVIKAIASTENYVPPKKADA
jgi:hypothetical protein